MKKHSVLKNTLDKDMCSFLNTYLLEKREVLKVLTKEKYISPFSELHGKLSGDPQIPNTFCIYGDIAMDIVLLKVLPIIQKKLK